MFWDLFRKTPPAAPAGKRKRKKQFRGFSGAAWTAVNNFNASMQDIRTELEKDLPVLTSRARALVKNNDTVASYVNLMIRNVLGDTGFRLNVTCRKGGKIEQTLNEEVEKEWFLYQKGAISSCGKLNGWGFDRQLLFNLLIDGEVFIWCLPDGHYEFIDPMDVDIHYSTYATEIDGIRITQGVELDCHGKPLAYHVKMRTVGAYGSGIRERIPADEVIHLFRANFVGQARGYTPLAPILLNLNSLDEYKKAEVNAALLSSLYMGVWEKTSSGVPDFEEEEEEEEGKRGEVAEVLEANVFRFAPEGYSLKGIQSSHPNSNLGAFFKSCMRGMASCLGLSYNKLNSDYESVNYSSLRQANVEDCATWREWQRYLIDYWKEVQFSHFLRRYLLSDMASIGFSRYKDIMYGHEFRGKAWEYLDPEKEYKAISLKLALKLTNPILEAEKLGMDMAEILDGWVVYKRELEQRGLQSLAGEKETLFPLLDEAPETAKTEETMEEE